MHATIERTLTAEDTDRARYAIGAHFTEAIADAETRGEPTAALLAEAADWATDHTLTDERARAILDHAPADERDIIAAYLAGSRP